MRPLYAFVTEQPDRTFPPTFTGVFAIGPGACTTEGHGKMSAARQSFGNSSAATSRASVLSGLLAFAAGVFLLAEVVGGNTGLRADYGIVGPDAQRISVASQVDPYLWLPRPASFHPPYLRRWDGAQLGFPSERPRVDVLWTGVLVVQRSGLRTFVIASAGEVTLEVGPLTITASAGNKTGEGYFPVGLHPVRVHFRASDDKPVLQVGEVMDGGRIRPLGPGLYPDASARRRHLWKLLVAAAVFLGATANAVRTTRGARGRWPAPYWTWFATAGLIVLSVGLRLYDRAAVPSYAETADEYYHAWVGWSLIHGKAPVGWSWAPAYGVPQVQRFFGEPYPIVIPFLDHPPLSPVVSTLIGSVAAWFTGWPAFPDHFPFDAPPLEALRISPILLSGLSLLLLLRLGLRLFGGETAFAAGLLYATTPLWVAQQRLVKEEAILTTLFLGGLLLILDRPLPKGLSLRRLSTGELLLLAIVGGLCPLLKITATICPLALAGILLADPVRSRRSEIQDSQSPVAHRYGAGDSALRAMPAATSPQRVNAPAADAKAARRALLWLLAGTVIGAALLLLFVSALDWRLYLQVQRWLGDKPSGPATIFGLLTQATVAHRGPSGPGWSLWFWMAALPALALRERRLLWTVLIYLLLLGAFTNPKLLYGWYLLPVQPLLALGAASLVVRRREPQPQHPEGCSLEGPDLRLAVSGLFLFWLLYVGTSLSLLESSGQLFIPPRILYAVAAVCLTPLAFFAFPPRAWRLIVWISIAIGTGLNAYLALQLRIYY